MGSWEREGFPCIRQQFPVSKGEGSTGFDLDEEENLDIDEEETLAM